MLATTPSAKSKLRHGSIPKSVRLASSFLTIETPKFLWNHLPRSDGQTVVCTHWRFLEHSVLEAVRPDIILAPLTQPNWDLMDLGSFLQRNKYSGLLCAVTQPLPSVEMIAKEFAIQFPLLTIDILEISPPEVLLDCDARRRP